jgi:hypothetical protein
MALRRQRDPKKAPPRAVTAATATVPLGPGTAWSTWRMGNRDWQMEAWRLYDIIPELRFLAGWIGDSVSQARLFVTEINTSGEESGEVTDGQIAELAAVPLGSGSQRDDNLRLAGIGLAVCGESWVVGEGGATSTPENWFVLSPGQIRRPGGGAQIEVNRPMQIGGGVLTLRDGTDLLMRAWRPHPNAIEQADSPARSAIPPLREIELLTKREFAEIESRLTGAGMWPLPEGLDFPRGEDDPEGLKGFMALMQRIMARNIEDQSSAASQVPIMFTVPDHMLEHLDKFKPITFWSELSAQIPELKEKAITRLGSAFEIPTELVTGLGASNHWTAWAIGEEGIKRIKPYLATIADTLTRGFLRPALERAVKAGTLAATVDPERYAYAFDTAPLAVRPNRQPEALELWDRFLITDVEAVKAGAFTKGQIPDDREQLRMILKRAFAADPLAMLADAGVREVLGIPGLPPAPAAPEEPRALPATPEPEEPDEENGPPAEAPDGPSESATIERLQFQLVRQQAIRALALAGGRMTTPAERRPTAKWGAVPKHELHSRVGPITPDRADRMLEGAWSTLPDAAEAMGLPEVELQTFLHGYAVELLTRGLAHSDDLLRYGFAALMHGRRP